MSGVSRGLIAYAKGAGLAISSAGLMACAAAAPMAGPVAGDTAGAAVEKSGDLVKAGKVQSYQPVAIDDMIAVARKAAGELDLKQTGEEKHPDQIKFIYEDQRGQNITVTLVRRTYKATEIHVDVGLLGNSGMGQLVMRQMLKDMPKSTQTTADKPGDSGVTDTLQQPATDSNMQPMPDTPK